VDWSGYSRIFSTGHRNPQGLFFAKNSKILFSTEHSIRGGDELNLIKNSTNYGFPCEAFSTYYSYDFSFPQKDKKLIGKDPLCLNKRFEPPIFYWPDKTGISQGVEYAGDEFPAFVGDLLIGSLAGHSLFRIQLGEANNVMFIERINLQERIRDLNISDSGKIIILTDGGSILVLSSVK
jgi:glucose/arabinose dehydrogenase